MGRSLKESERAPFDYDIPFDAVISSEIYFVTEILLARIVSFNIPANAFRDNPPRWLKRDDDRVIDETKIEAIRSVAVVAKPRSMQNSWNYAQK